MQLLRATAHGRAIFTFNACDFQALACRYPRHAGIVLAALAKWNLSGLVADLDRLLTEARAEVLLGRVCRLGR